MKLSFIDVRYKHEVTLPEDFIVQLPERVILFLNIQFHSQYDRIKGQLERAGKTVISVRPKHAWNEGQILGCSIEEWEKGQQAFVYVGDGLFHPKAILFNNTQSVFMYDPKTGERRILAHDEIAGILKSKKAAFATFYASERIGVLLTTKYGQARIVEAMKLREKFPDKEFYLLLADVIPFDRLEDFSFIQCFINTACPRIIDDTPKVPRPMINLSDLGIEW